MKKLICILLAVCLSALLAACAGGPEDAGRSAAAETNDTTIRNEQGEETMTENKQTAKLLYMGHASIRITTPVFSMTIRSSSPDTTWTPATGPVLSVRP